MIQLQQRSHREVSKITTFTTLYQQLWPINLSSPWKENRLPLTQTHTHLLTHPHNSQSWHAVPITEQSRRRLVVSPSPASRGLSFQDGGRGIRRPMGRWNLRRRGSTVTTGLKFAWLPSSFATSSSGTGWAWCQNVNDGEREGGGYATRARVWWYDRKNCKKKKEGHVE